MPFDATPEGRARAALYGRKGGYIRIATADRQKLAQSGQEGLIARFERQVDPDGLLSPEERRTRALFLREAHMANMSARRILKQRARKAAARATS